MSDFGYDKLKYTENLRVTTPDRNTKEGRGDNWDNRLGKLFRQVYIDMGTDGIEGVIKVQRFFDNFHNLATAEMKRAFITSDAFIEMIEPYRETMGNIAKLYR